MVDGLNNNISYLSLKICMAYEIYYWHHKNTLRNSRIEVRWRGERKKGKQTREEGRKEGIQQ